MTFIYNTGLKLYFILIKIAALFSSKAALWLKGRKGLLEKLRVVSGQLNNVVWVHCASLGEFEQGRPLIEKIKTENPEVSIVLTFFSPSGYEVRKDYDKVDFVCYLPLDTPQNAKTFIDIVQPQKVFFIKYEYWYNYLNELRKIKVPVYFVSAIFRENQLFFKPIGSWYRKMLYKVERFFLQDESSARLLDSIGIKKYEVVGDTRFDRVAQVAMGTSKLPLVEEFLEGQKAFVVGSTWKQDEELLQNYLKATNDKVIIAPHEVNENSIARLTKIFNGTSVCYSALDSYKNSDEKRVLIIDCYGLLSSIYRYGKMAYVGGGFGAGIHNVLEAATFGMPVVFGPNYKKFREAVDLVSLGSAYTVSSEQEFNTVVKDVFNNDKTYLKAAQLASDYVQKHVGSTQKIIDFVFNN